MNVIGLAMISHEDDILGSVLQYNAPLVDAFYVLDGTVPNTKSRRLCEYHVGCCGYWQDAELPEEYGGKPRDGWREFLLQAAYADWGHDNWFCLLHGDEVWTINPRQVVDEHPGVDGFVFSLPVYFPRDEWQEGVHPFDQLTWHLGPGWPEFRMFRGGVDVHYDPQQHFNVQPSGIGNVRAVPYAIKHYAYRSPEVQRARAARHTLTGFDPDNYRHITEEDHVIWTEGMIARWQAEPCWRKLARDA